GTRGAPRRVAPAIVPLAGPGSETQQDASAAEAAHGPPLTRRERDERARPRRRRLAAGADLDVAFGHDDPRALLDLVVAQLLTGLEADEDGAGLVLRVQNDRGDRATGGGVRAGLPA